MVIFLDSVFHGCWLLPNQSLREKRALNEEILDRFLTAFATIVAFFLLLGIVLGAFAFIASAINNRIVACAVVKLKGMHF